MTEGLLADLEEARRRSRLSKAEVARLAKVQPAAVRRLLTSSERNPTLGTLTALAAAVQHQIRVVPQAFAGDKGFARDSPEGGSARLERVSAAAEDLRQVAAQPFKTVLTDPPWRFINRTGKVAPEHRRLSRYDTMTLRRSPPCRWTRWSLTVLTFTCGCPTRCWPMGCW